LRVNRHRVWAAAFGMDAEAMLVCVVAEKFVVMVNRQIAQRIAIIKKKAVALRRELTMRPASTGSHGSKS